MAQVLEPGPELVLEEEPVRESVRVREQEPVQEQGLQPELVQGLTQGKATALVQVWAEEEVVGSVQVTVGDSAEVLAQEPEWVKVMVLAQVRVPE